MHIPFNHATYSGNEATYLQQALAQRHLAGDGPFTQKAVEWLEAHYGYLSPLLTTSCTDALELAALLAGIQAGDEVIVPAFTFSTTATAFLRCGATLKLADSCAQHPNIDLDHAASLVGPRTKALVLVHYAGMACNLEKARALAAKHGLFLIEDAAQGFGAYYRSQPLGTLGDFGAFSFHETKWISAGEAGLLLVNDTQLRPLAETMRDKGTNRQAFIRGDLSRYEWVSEGSSFLPSDITAAVLLAQFEQASKFQARRKAIWQQYQILSESVLERGIAQPPQVPEYAKHNASLFYWVFSCPKMRQKAQTWLKSRGVETAFHYVALHQSQFYRERYGELHLPNAQKFTECLLRFPIYPELDEQKMAFITEAIAALPKNLDS